MPTTTFAVDLTDLTNTVARALRDNQITAIPGGILLAWVRSDAGRFVMSEVLGLQSRAAIWDAIAAAHPHRW